LKDLETPLEINLFSSQTYHLNRIITEIKNVSAWLWEKSWAEKNAGNLSVDVTNLITIKKRTKKSDKIPKHSLCPLSSIIFLPAKSLVNLLLLQQPSYTVQH